MLKKVVLICRCLHVRRRSARPDAGDMARRSALEVGPRALTVLQNAPASWVVAGGWPWRTGRSIPYVSWRLCRGSVQSSEYLTPHKAKACKL